VDVYLVDGTYELFRHYYALPSARGADGREAVATVAKPTTMPETGCHGARRQKATSRILASARYRLEVLAWFQRERRAFFLAIDFRRCDSRSSAIKSALSLGPPCSST